jgi:hypothetical protein
MHPDATLVAMMKTALLATNEQLERATKQAWHLRDVMERMPVADLAAATEERDGSSYLHALALTCASLDALREAYAAVEATIQSRTEQREDSGGCASTS